MRSQDEQLFRKKWRDKLASERLPKSMKLRYRLFGGMPSERLDNQFTLSGDGETKVTRRDMLVEPKTRRATSRLSVQETRSLFQELESGLDSLIQADQAEFPFDSVVGSLTLTVAGETVTYYFPVEQEKLPTGFRASPPLQSAFQRIDMLSRRMLEKGGGE